MIEIIQTYVPVEFSTIASTVLSGAILWGIKVLHRKLSYIENLAEQNREKVNDIQDKLCN